MDTYLQHCSFHATWNLDVDIVKPFELMVAHTDQHIENETHPGFCEEGLLFKSYLCMSGIGGSKDKKKALEALTEAINLVNDWDESPTKDGFLVVAYALEAWIDMDKTEKRIQDLHRLQNKNSNDPNGKPSYEATFHFIKGFSLSRVNRYIGSIDEFRQATELCPDNPDYLFSFALTTTKCYGPTVEVKTNLKKVLEMKPDYLYAKVELANAIRVIDEDTIEPIRMLDEVTQVIISSGSVTPEYKKMLGLIMKIHLKINPKDENGKAKDIYKEASKFGITSNMAHQRAKLAKNRGQYTDYEQFLNEAANLDPFNIFVKLDLINQSRLSVDDVIETYDKLLLDHENDQPAAVNIFSEFGHKLFKLKENEKALVRYEKALEKAIKFCQIDPCVTSNRMKFIPNVRFAVKTTVLNITKIYKSDDKNCKVMIKLIKLQYEMRNFYLTRAYCKRALKMPLDDKQEYEVSRILAEIEINLSSDLNSLAEVENQIETLKHLAKDDKVKLKEVEELEQVDLNFKMFILQERMALYHIFDQKAIGSTTLLRGYCVPAMSGHKGAIKRLLSALEVLDKGNSLFYEICAYLEISIQSLSIECDDEQRMLRSVLQTAVTGDLYHLRRQQLEMEKAFINKSDQLVRKIEIVIQTSRNMLNSAMHKLEMRYRKQIDGKQQRRGFIVHFNFDKSDTKEKVIKKLREYKWIDTDEELVEFLVEVQPCTNPKVNNWIMAFIEFNNITKHQKEAKQYGTYNVYPEDQGTEYEAKEYCSIDLARTVCNNIAYILDNLNGFTLDF